ncbi:MAG: macrophage infectivity potentiator [Bacteroidetes bacterium]|nr:macrophage infectivity potentiator [Bacteroidota bacterium]
MKKVLLGAVAFVAFAMMFTACSKDRVETNELKDMKDSVSYALGLNIGQSMKAEGFELNTEIMLKAIQQGYKGDTVGAMKQEQLQNIMMKYQELNEKKKQSEMQAKQQKEAKVNRPKTDKFLAENKTAPGVVTTASGLQYKVVAEGKGVKPVKDSDRVRFHLKVSYLDGQVLQNTFEKGQEPVLTTIQGVSMNMPFLVEGFKMMSAGSRYIFYISPDLIMAKEMSDGKLLIVEIEVMEVLPEGK